MSDENKQFESARGNAIDRRSALKGLAAVGAAAAFGGMLAGCSSPAETGSAQATATTPASEVSWDGEYDIVVVGAGGAGLGAALTAIDNGASVLSLEIESSTAFSNTSLCGGVVMACGTSVQKAAGIEGDNAEEFKKYIDAVSGGLAYEDLMHQWADRSTETFEWLVEKGVVFPPEYMYYSGQEEAYADAAKPAMRGHIAEGHVGSSITDVLFAEAEKAGAEFLFKTQVTDLVIDDETGAVVGVTAGNANYKANKGVILTCGGFSRNADLLKNFIPDMIYGGSFGSSHQQGDGIKMGINAGAKIGNMWAVQAKCTGTSLSQDVTPCNTIYSWGNPCVMVTEEGVREIREDSFYENHYAFIGAQPHAYTYIVWDQAVTDLGSDVISVPPMSAGLKSETDAGLICKADTFEELAAQMDVPKEAFVETMNHYNEMMAAGEDTDLGRKVGLGAVNTPPYYAVKLIPAICDTAGGLVVNTKYEVLDNYDEPIPGLYAAGATSAGWRGKYYAGSGTAVSYAIASGRIAAETALGM